MDDVAQAINHFSVLMEDQNAKLDAVLEGINSLPTRDDFHRLERRMESLESDMKVVKVAVVDLSSDLAEHKRLPAHAAHRHA
jgi:hypothetical protein